MWPVARLIAEAAAPAWQQYILPALLALVGVVAAAWIALRGTFRTASVNHETEFDKLVHARIQTLEKQVAEKDARIEVLTADRDRYRELHAQLRLDVLAAGLNPDRLGKGGGDAVRNTT
ncbi:MULTISPECIES: hypothetical protein [Actinomycetes]|uniref:Uncharacterized protein n=2 Tax=Actinomycetes TaxID=1760 RepID=A0A917X1L8_9ACTN|nr:hypothetical protein [Dactylosporangium sucinum]GGM53125.1 hypothetical protein GCM10007977_063470 [Dactylosporangium sucinum]